MTDLLTSQRDAVVAAALAHVPFDGWTWKAIGAGAKDAGMAEIDAKRLFTDGLAGAADHFADWADRRMLAALEAQNLASMGIRDRIHACVKTRIVQNTPYKEALRRLLSFLALPGNAPLATTITWRSCSRMWYAAGDRSADWNHYSKRGLLAAEVTGAKASEDKQLPRLVIEPIAAQQPEVLAWAKEHLTTHAGIHVAAGPLEEVDVGDEDHTIMGVARIRQVSRREAETGWAGAALALHRAERDR